MCEGGENELCVGWPAFSVSVGRGMSGGRGGGLDTQVWSSGERVGQE